MIVDYTITVGNIIEIGVLLAGGVGAILTMRTSVKNLQSDMVSVQKELEKLSDVVVRQAVTTTRLDNLEADIRDMKHGRGFIQDRASGGINGEYP